MDKKVLIDTLGWGLLLWFIGYVLDGYCNRRRLRLYRFVIETGDILQAGCVRLLRADVCKPAYCFLVEKAW
jgi:hypothetical protein